MAPEPNWNWPDSSPEQGAGGIVIEAEGSASQTEFLAALDQLTGQMRAFGPKESPVHVHIALPKGVRVVAMRTA